MQETIGRIVDMLPHTPFGFGLNFTWH